MVKTSLLLILLSSILVSCGEEVLTKNTVSESITTKDIESFQLTTCAQMRFNKPPVDILYVIDNSGSTLNSDFEQIKKEIKRTINTISNDFDYHIYFTPLMKGSGEDNATYPVIASDPQSFPSLANINLVTPDNLQPFAQPTGGNLEYGFQRIQEIIDNNRTNGIFRNNANTIVVMISNGDDTETLTTVGGNKVRDPSKYNSIKENLLKYTKKYAQSNSVSNPLNAETFRLISLVAHSTCFGWTPGATYKDMSKDIYNYQSLTDDGSSYDSRNLCNKNYSNLFKAVNNSIRATVEGHHYDHWKISNASEDDIEESDITVTKIKSNGTKEVIAQDSTNGFEYLGYKQNQATRYLPDVGEKVTGLVIKLNGNARVKYPDCLIAKTRTPTEYFGYMVLPREPDTTTIVVEIDGKKLDESSQNGWTYIGYRDTVNIKVPGPTNASVTPEVNKTGYVIKLHGNAIFTNGQTVEVFYKPKSI